MTDLSERIVLALEWMKGMAIQQREDSAFGALRAGYDARKGRPLPPYTEITGYGVSLLVQAYGWTRDEALLSLAHQAARYLLGVQDPDSGAFLQPTRTDGGDQRHALSWAFDTAACVSGLLDLYGLSGGEEYLQGAQAAGRWLIQVMQRPDGAFTAYQGDQSERGEDPIFGTGSCIHAKHALALFRLQEHTGEEEYLSNARKVCDYTLGLQRGDGAFWASPARTIIFTHACCYTLEGLIALYARTGDQCYREAFLGGTAWLRSRQGRDGGVRQQGWGRPMGRAALAALAPFSASDATAQAVRLWLIASDLAGEPSYLVAAERALSFLAGMQPLRLGDKGQRGGVRYRKLLGWRSPLYYTWCTLFTISAFQAWQCRVSGRYSWQTLTEQLY